MCRPYNIGSLTNFKFSTTNHALFVQIDVACCILRPRASYVHSILRHELEGVPRPLSTFISLFSASQVKFYRLSEVSLPPSLYVKTSDVRGTNRFPVMAG